MAADNGPPTAIEGYMLGGVNRELVGSGTVCRLADMVGGPNHTDKAKASSWKGWALLIGVLAGLALLWRGATAECLPGWLHSVYRWPGGDTVGHLVIYGTASVLVHCGLPPRGALWHGFLRPLTAVLLLAVVVEEPIQVWLPSRSFSISDLAANIAGVLAGAWLARPRR